MGHVLWRGDGGGGLEGAARDVGNAEVGAAHDNQSAASCHRGLAGHAYCLRAPRVVMHTIRPCHHYHWATHPAAPASIGVGVAGVVAVAGVHDLDHHGGTGIITDIGALQPLAIAITEVGVTALDLAALPANSCTRLLEQAAVEFAEWQAASTTARPTGNPSADRQD